MESISKANKRPVNSEDLIKYAHRISSTYSVSAPFNWQQGDQRRPYPTGDSGIFFMNYIQWHILSSDHEMRAGMLGQNGPLLQSHTHLSDSLSKGHHPGSQEDLSKFLLLIFFIPSIEPTSAGIGGTFSWQPSGDLAVHVGGHSAVVEKKEQEDVEVMSTDSSSTSSSDSQWISIYLPKILYIINF